MTWIYVVTIVYLAGVYLGLKNNTLVDIQWLILLCIFGALAILLAVKNFTKVFFVVLLGIFFNTGLFFGLNRSYPKLDLAPLFNTNVQFEGRIDPLTVRHGEYGNSCIVSTKEIKSKNFVSKNPVNIRIFTNQLLPDSGILAIKGKLKQLHCLSNFGVFDMETWNRVQGLGGIVNKAECLVIQKFEWDYLDVIDVCALVNDNLKKYWQENIKGEAGILLGNMILGGNGGLAEETKEIFAANGISHLLAVSGTHIAFLAGFLIVIFSFLQRRCESICVVVCLALYVAICGFRPSVLRGFLMSLPIILSIHGMDKGRFLAIITIFFLAIKPVWLLDVGFQLSFGAVAGLLWLGPKIRGYMHLFFPYYVAEIFTVTAAAQLGTLPLVLHYFHQFSLLSFLASLFLVPLLELGVILALLGSCVHYIFDLTWFMRLAGMVLEEVLHCAELLSQLSFLKIILPLQPLWTWVCYYLFLLFFFDYAITYFIPFIWRRRLTKCWGFLLVISLVVTIFWPQGNRLYFMDVGQGDGAIFISNQGETIVIDTGGAYGYDVGSRVLVPFLYGKGITEIDVLLLSHGDMDHAGGAAGLIRNISCKNIILPAGDASEYIDKLLQVAGSSRVWQAKTGDVIPLRYGHLKILSAPEQARGNASSVVAELRCGINSVLFTGDLTREGENQLVLEHSYDILKVSHHGSQYSSSKEFLELVKPQVAVISVGRDNVYQHPHKAVLERLRGVGTAIYRTDYDGMVEVELLDDGFAVEKIGKEL